MITRILTPLAAVAAFGLILGGMGIQQAAAQNDSIPEIEWDTTLNKFQFDADKFVGQRFTATCPPAARGDLEQTVYGTDTYPSNNSICVAAMHAGRIDEDGGTVTVQLNLGASKYTGSGRNGVQTADLPGTQRSIVFVGPTNAQTVDQLRMPHIPRVKWDTKFTATGFAHKRLIGQTFTFNCPAAPNNLRPRRIVGTDSYAFHSMICRAAVHAGQITPDGGFVSVQIDPGKTKLVGSIRNGVESKDGPGGHRTLSFVDGTAQM